jgi:hypothetical protein
MVASDDVAVDAITYHANISGRAWISSENGGGLANPTVTSVN